MRNSPAIRSSPYLGSISPKEWAIIFGAWTLFGLAQVGTQMIAVRPSMTYQMPVWYSMGQYLPRVWLWAALTPLIEAWDRWLRDRFDFLPVRISLHAPLYLLAALSE